MCVLLDIVCCSWLYSGWRTDLVVKVASSHSPSKTLDWLTIATLSLNVMINYFVLTDIQGVSIEDWSPMPNKHNSLTFPGIIYRCPRRNVPDFGRVFLMLKYADITQNTYIQSWMVTEVMAREKFGLLAVPRTAPFQLTHYVYTAHVLETGMQSTACLRAHVKCLEP